MPEVEEFSDEVAPAPPADPASLAIAMMIRKAVAANGQAFTLVGKDGSVTLVTLPDPCWTALAANAWGDLARGGVAYSSGGYDRRWHGPNWAAWAPTDQQHGYHMREAAERFADAIASGEHCAAFASDVTWLPADLVNAADNRVSVSVLTGDDVHDLARELCGDGASERVTDGEAAVLSPRLLRLARRPGQKADGYVHKLRDLVGRETVAVAVPAVEATASPRDTPTLDRLHGMDEAVAWGRRVARDLEGFKAGRLPWSAVDRGCLLSGPPGCGKTLFAKAIAASCGVPLTTGSYGAWHASGTGHQGDFLRAMQKTFEKARSTAPGILFVDEIDAFPDRNTIVHHYASYEIQIVNSFLSEVDGVDGRDGVIFIGACNYPQKLDPALLRSGRLDRHIRIGLPDRAALASILREHLGTDLEGEELSGAALAAAGATGADCERFVRDARRRARSENRAMVVADLLSEIGGTDNRSDEDRWIAAIHEAGHAVAACALWPGSLGAVSLRTTGNSGGRMETMPTRSVMFRATDFHERLVILLAGRAAEEEVLGVPSSGAGGWPGSDLATATALAVQVSCAFGFDEIGGLVWRGLPEVHRVPEALGADPMLAERVRVRLDRAYTDARALLRGRLAAVQAVATRLVERGALDGAEVGAIVSNNAPMGVSPP